MSETPLYFETLVTLTRGELAVVDALGMARALKRWRDGEYLLRLEPATAKRTSAQNRYWHGIVIPHFMAHCGYHRQDRDEFAKMKDALALRLLPQTITDLNGEETTVPGHTATLTKAEFQELIERAQELAAGMGLILPAPEEVFQGVE